MCLGQNKKYIVFFTLFIFTLIFHLVGCFYLYDFENDEGGWLINAKNYALFGQYSLEGAYYTALSPLNTFLHIPLFKIFGPSIFLGRYVSIVFAIFTLVIFFALLKKKYGLPIAGIACAMIIINGVYNRITTLAVLEAKLHLLQILTVCFCFSSKRWVRNCAFLPFALALAFKPSAVYFIFPLLYILGFLNNKSTGEEKGFSGRISDMLFFLGSTFIIAGAFFYLAYLFDPENFLYWGLKVHLSGRLDIRYLLMNSSQVGLAYKLIYFFWRSPVSSVIFLLGLVFALKKKEKTILDKFLLIWIITELIFFLFQFYVSVNYFIDLIFPLSVFSAQFIISLGRALKLERVKAEYLLVSIAVMALVSSEVGSSLYYFLVIKPQRPAIKSSQWLKQEKLPYGLILSPAQIAIDIPVKTMVTSNIFRVSELLEKKEVGFPLLCVMQSQAANYYPEDYILLKDKGRFIRAIGYFWFYEIPAPIGAG
jgi:4-amino-4-deoxy-L-arabinose transferase-like glycosyltransferase